MTSLDGRLIDIACTVVGGTVRSVTVADGTEETVEDKRSGGSYTRLKHFYLPRSLVAIRGDGTVRMPEWLAKQRGLI